MNIKPNRFLAFLNRQKKPNTDYPDMKGEGRITCPDCKHEIEVDIAIWAMKTKTKQDYFSGLFQFPDKNSEAYKKRKADDAKAMEQYKKRHGGSSTNEEDEAPF